MNNNSIGYVLAIIIFLFISSCCKQSFFFTNLIYFKNNCSKIIQIYKKNQPKSLHLLSNRQYFTTTTFKFCFIFTRNNLQHQRQHSLQHKQHFILRLDYLPFLCISANNDNIMKQIDETTYFTEVIVSRNCFVLDKKQQVQEIEFVYEVKEGIQFFNVISYKYFISVYIPVLIGLGFIAILLERIIFRGQNIVQAKYQ